MIGANEVRIRGLFLAQLDGDPVIHVGEWDNPYLTREEAFLVALAEVGDEVYREVFGPPTVFEEKHEEMHRFWKGEHYARR